MNGKERIDCRKQANPNNPRQDDKHKHGIKHHDPSNAPKNEPLIDIDRFS
jgi:hypothetical protein